jgi:hypothetical protein
VRPELVSALGSADPVNAKVYLLDPGSRDVIWMTEAASAGASSDADGSSVLGEAMPMAEILGVPGAVAAVLETGEPQHLRTDLVSTSKGAMALATSVYLLPDGVVMVVTENAWSARHEPRGARPGGGTSRR